MPLRPRTPPRRASALGLALAAGLSSALAPAASVAQQVGPWTWRATVYLYLPSVGGSTRFSDPGGGSADVDTDASRILDALKLAFMGSLEAHNGRWGGFTDVMYVDLGESRSAFRDFSLGGAPIPVGASADARYDLKGALWTIGAQYRVQSDPRSRLDVLAGVRLLDVNATFEWRLDGNVGSIPVVDRDGRRSADLSRWDAVVGIKGRAAFGPDGKWFAPYHADIGAGGSKLTWQAMGGIGYSFGWGDAFVAYRHVDYRMKSGQPIQSLSLGGPMVAASFAW